MQITAVKHSTGRTSYTVQISEDISVAVVIEGDSRKVSINADRYDIGQEPQPYTVITKGILAFLDKLDVVRDVVSKKYDIELEDLNPAISFNEFVLLYDGKFISHDEDFNDVIGSLEVRFGVDLVQEYITPNVSFGEIVTAIMNLKDVVVAPTN